MNNGTNTVSEIMYIISWRCCITLNDFHVRRAIFMRGINNCHKIVSTCQLCTLRAFVFFLLPRSSHPVTLPLLIFPGMFVNYNFYATICLFDNLNALLPIYWNQFLREFSCQLDVMDHGQLNFGYCRECFRFSRNFWILVLPCVEIIFHHIPEQWALRISPEIYLDQRTKTLTESGINE